MKLGLATAVLFSVVAHADLDADYSNSMGLVKPGSHSAALEACMKGPPAKTRTQCLMDQSKLEKASRTKVAHLETKRADAATLPIESPAAPSAEVDGSGGASR